MSTLSSSLINQADSILACAHCARSKAKCDRKKKLSCQVRVSQRGPGRSALNYKLKEPTSINSNPNKDSNSAPVNDNAPNRENEAIAPCYPTGRGIYLDWNHSATNIIQRTIQQDDLGDDPLASFIAAVSGVEEAYPSNISLSSGSMQQGQSCSDNVFDFTFPNRGPSPTTQKTSLTGIPPQNIPFGMPPENLPNLTDEDEIMENYGQTVSSLPSLESENSDLDRLVALEGWPLFQCNPVIPSSTCVPTAANHVTNMHSLLSHENMTTQDTQPVACSIAIEPLLASTREKLSAVLQGLYNEAQELYELRCSNNRIPGYAGGSILVLPPPLVLELSLRSYLLYCEPYYPFIRLVSMNINERMKEGNTILTSMLLLLIFAAGALAPGASETHSKIAHGLIEICRIPLRNLIEKNIKLASDHEFSQCALLNLIVSVWSGDKWQMDVSSSSGQSSRAVFFIDRLSVCLDCKLSEVDVLRGSRPICCSSRIF
ncbi:hypothetical protein N7528_009010 [Penicillium herquei]|nr:hypothetical protein N7528_009010 [Penicillium herquei]